MMKKSSKAYGNCWKGMFEVKNPNKYAGKEFPIFRSRLERRLMTALDSSVHVVQWASEQPHIPYIHPIRTLQEGKQIVWNYHPDFLIKLTNGTKTWVELVEIKPSKQTKKPLPWGKGRSIKLANYEAETYAVNVAKWESAIELCEKNGWVFRIITERTLDEYIRSIL
jgi:hypothetical protein